MFCVMHSNNTGALSLSGWTELLQFTPSGETCRFGVFWKTAGASESATVTGSAGGSAFWGMVVSVHSGSGSYVVDSAANSAGPIAGGLTLTCSATRSRTVAANSLEFAAAGMDNRDTGNITSADNGFGNVDGAEDDQITALGSKINGGTGKTYGSTEDVDFSPTVTFSDDSFSIHVSFLEDSGETASGTPDVPVPTASGSADVIKGGSGTPSTPTPTTSGTARAGRSASGAPSTPVPTADGAAEVIKSASGAPSVPVPTVSGVAGVIKSASGAISVPVPVAAGNAAIPSSVVITDVDTDETWQDGETGLVITGSGFV